jgi:hypothetical protein
LAVVKDWRNIAKTGGGYDRRGCIAVIRGIIVDRPGARNDLRICFQGWANRVRGRTPTAARAGIHANLRARLCQTQHDDKGRSYADYDFRFHGIAMLPYINAHELASCNTDCCRIGGNLRIALGLRLGKIDGRLLQIDPRLARQAGRRTDSHPHGASRPALQGDWTAGFRERSRLELSAQKHDLQCPNSWSRRCAAQEL